MVFSIKKAFKSMFYYSEEEELPSTSEIRSLFQSALGGNRDNIIKVAQLAYPEEKIRGLRQKILNNSKLVESIINEASLCKIALNYWIEWSDIEIKEELGKGGGGAIVYKGLWDNKKVAVKVFDFTECTDDQKMDVLREMAITALFDHKNIIKLYGGCADNDRAFMVMQYCKNGDLISYLEKNKLNLKQKLVLLKQVAKAMECVHNVNIMYRDMKPHNVLIGSNGQAILTDFGASRSVPSSKNKRISLIGTPQYMAPECIDVNYAKEVDIFSFGIMMWQVITGESPYKGYREFDLRAAKKEGVRPTIPPTMNPKLANILIACWDSDASKRPSFSQLRKMLKVAIKSKTLQVKKTMKNKGWEELDLVIRFVPNEKYVCIV